MPSQLARGNFQAFIPGTDHTLPINSATTQITATIGVGVTVVRIYATKKCHVAFGVDPSATTASMPIAAEIPEYVGVVPGWKIASILDTVTGTMIITEGISVSAV